MFRFITFVALVAAASAQFLQTPAITSQNQNIYRSFGNLGQVSTYSKTIDTPFSSVSKSDVRVSNPGYTVGRAIAPAYAAPIAHGYAAPIAHGYAAPIAHGYSPLSTYGHPAIATAGYVSPLGPKTLAPAGLLGVAYSAAPTVAHMTYSNGLGFNYAW